jgi:hypothetical protein
MKTAPQFPFGNRNYGQRGFTSLPILLFPIIKTEGENMNHENILELARVTADRLGIPINDPALVLSNMKPSTGITSILYKGDLVLWVDKHYVAYGSNRKPEVVYIYADAEHVREELLSVLERMKKEKSPYYMKTLMSVKEQLQLANEAIKKSGNGLYLFESEESTVNTNKTETQWEVKTLCYKCKSDYENTGGYYIRRADLNQSIKETCDFCSVRSGYDYEFAPKARKEVRV